MIKFNGIETEISDSETLFDFIGRRDYNISVIASELNGAIVPKSEYKKTMLKDGDKLEIVSFVGGG